MQFERRKKPEGFKELLVYRRAVELQDFIYKLTENFSWRENRRREHMRDSARSVKQNIVEGWKRETTRQYIDFLSFSFGSLGELKEDGEDCLKIGLIGKEVFKELMRKCGEIDFLMGRLKSSLERKITKEDVLSPYDRWLGREMAEKMEENKKFDEELKGIIEMAKREKREKGENRSFGRATSKWRPNGAY